jgi:hypothetical protein
MNNHNGWWRQIFQKNISPKNPHSAHMLNFDGLMKNDINMTLPW